MISNLEKYKNIPYTIRTKCMVCDDPISDVVIDLPHFPMTEIYVEKKVTEELAYVNQTFHYCTNCGHGQLANIIEPEMLYSGTYFTRTSTSSSAKSAIDVFLEFINNNIKSGELKCIVEIGCNDTYLLKKLKPKAKILFGIDPFLKGKESEFRDDKIHLIGEYFEKIETNELAKNIDLIISSHTLEHIVDPKETIRSLLAHGNSKSLFVFQFPGLEPLINNARFDQVHNQHINYFSLNSVWYMLNELGAELINYQYNHGHWGALMIAFTSKPSKSNPGTLLTKSNHDMEKNTLFIQRQFNIFKEMMDNVNHRLLSFQKRPVYGYGAALMLPLLKYHIPEVANFQYILDEDYDKIGLYYINLPVKIIHPKKIQNLTESIVCITAINSKQVIRTILSKLIGLKIRDIVIPVNLI